MPATTETSRLATLTARHEPPCISIFLPSEMRASLQQGDLAALTALLKTAGAGLAGTEITVEQVADLLRSRWNLVEQAAAAHKNAQGWAIFMAGNFFDCCPLGEPFVSRAVIGRDFYVRPLLSNAGASERYFLLTLSKKQVRLFEGSRDSIHHVQVEMVPASLLEDLESQGFERSSQFHSVSPAAAGKRGSVFYGTDINQKERILHFFRGVDRTVARLLKGETAPLVLAAVEYLFPIYRAANTYPHLVENGVAGNPDLVTAAALHAASWKIVESGFEEGKASAFEMYKKLVNTERTSSNLREVLVAAERARVRYLFVPSTGEQWGALILPNTVHLHSQPEPGDDELLNLAAVLTIRNDGQVYVVPPETLREGAPLAAVFRS